ncbi:DUF4349 domain-containing protein [Acutalibacter intestini]|uniref:DUF4349 domain-containing protein n=1 Tax=Acutalibacter intestini TaxID=3093659 RepID=UPI002AC9D934|nr:DUF4349 domain-containing protein [Acutalibacter sp. M00204]
MRKRLMQLRAVLGMSLVILLVFSLSACAGNGGDKSNAYAAQETGSTSSAAVEEVERGFESTPESTEGVRPRDHRKLITTVHLGAETKEYDSFLIWLEEELQQVEGYVESSEMDSYGSHNRSCQMTLRVPAQQLNHFLETVGENCNIVTRSRQEEDVTLNYVDAESYRQALRVEEGRLLELLEEAKSLEDILNIEDRLATVRAQLQSYESTLRVYDNQIDYSTVYLNLREVADLTQPEPESWMSRAWSGMKENARDLGRFFQELGLFLVVHLPTLVLLLAIVGIILLCTARPRRQARERREQQKKLIQDMQKEQRRAQVPQAEREEDQEKK